MQVKKTTDNEEENGKTLRWLVETWDTFLRFRTGSNWKTFKSESDGNTRDGGLNSWSRRWNEVEKRAVVLFKDAISLMNLGKEMKRRISSISMGLNATEWRPSSRGMRSELLSRVAVFRVHAPKIYYLFTSWPFHSLPRPQSHRVID